MFFKNRAEAGRMLARKLEKFKDEDVVVYALPRGGVVVATEIAKILKCPLDLIITRKIGHPQNNEYAIAAVAGNGHIAMNEKEVSRIDHGWMENEIEKQKEEIKRRREAYLQNREPLPAKGKTAIIVDDGIATGLTMKAAIFEIKHQNPKKIIIAVPVAGKQTAIELEGLVNEVIGVDITDNFSGAIGSYYEEFEQVSDEEVIKLLKGLGFFCASTPEVAT